MAETANDMNMHMKTYDGFIRMFKWGAPIVFVIGFVVILLIS